MIARAPTPTFKAIAPKSSSGVWSPSQKSDHRPPPFEFSDHQQPSEEKDENGGSIPPVWTPRSAGASPTAERKEFRPVHFDSPTLERKHKPPQFKVEAGKADTRPPWKAPDCVESAERKIPTSHSAPASGFGDFSSPRLPRAQNPTITLLQKAREGQLPRGASYIQTQDHPHRRPRDDRPPIIGPAEVLYQIKQEYTSEGEGERQRKMADLAPRKFEVGIGPTTRDGMPLVLRSEVREGNQSKWYKRMYDTIHKQKPDSRYPYSSGYFSEPEPGVFGYDSDGTQSDSRYTTLDRRRVTTGGADKENDYMSSTVPRSQSRYASSSEIIRHGPNYYRNQPGRIENYIPGHSSISDKEAKEWWDEVMDIFDGWLDDHSSLPSYNYLLSRAIARSHLEQQRVVPQQSRSYMSQALKESGYESDSTLVFRRREEAAQQLSPSEQKEAYKTIQKGGDVPLHGLRKTVPERPKDEGQLEYFPISPTLTRIRIHKNIKPQTTFLCYPVTVPPHPRHVFANYKRSAPSTVTVKPPSPPKRRSSRNNNTLKMLSNIKPKLERSPLTRRHETCFTSISRTETSKVKHLKDRITCKLTSTEGCNDPKSRNKITTTIAVTSPSLVRASTSSSSLTTSTKSRNMDSRRSLSSSPSRTICRTGSIISSIRSRSSPSTKPSTAPSRNPITRSPDLLSPTQVKRATKNLSRITPLSNKCSELRMSASTSPQLRSSRGRTTTPSPCPSTVSEKSKGSSRKSPSTSMDSLRSITSVKKENPKTIVSISKTTSRPKAKIFKDANGNDVKKTKLKKNQVNGEIARREKKSKSTSYAMRSEDPRPTRREIRKILRNPVQPEISNDIYKLTREEIQKQKEAIQTNAFFQNLFCKGLPSIPPSLTPENSWVAEKTRMLQMSSSSHSEPTVGALRIYLNHIKPVSDSKFRSLDSALRSRSTSPKSVTWKIDREERSLSLPPKLYFSETSRPPSPIISKKQSFKPLLTKPSPTSQKKTFSPKVILTETSRVVSPTFSKKYPTVRAVRPASPNPKMYFSQTSRPISPTVSRNRNPVEVEQRSKSPSPIAKMYFSDTVRPVSPVIPRKQQLFLIPRERSVSPTKLVFSQTSRPLTPSTGRDNQPYESKLQKSSSTSKLFFSQTIRPVSPSVARKIENYIAKKDEEPYVSKLYFSQTSRPVSPVVRSRSSSPMIRSFSPERDRSLSPAVQRTHDVMEKFVATETSRPISPSPTSTRRNVSLSAPSSPIAARSPSSRKINYCREVLRQSRPVAKQYQVNIAREQPENAYSSLKCHDIIGCNKFKELNTFYSTLERMGELERTTSSTELRPRRRGEDEIIDFDRWKEVHAREKAEKELETLYLKLKDDEKQKGFLFRPKEVEAYRWKRDLDRGLRIKDKSVERIKEDFEKLKEGSDGRNGIRDELMFVRDLYKPLWRGTSVADLASSMVERRSQSEGRVSSIKQKLDTERLLTRGVGSRIWSSLSSEQINILKGQLAEIYNSQNDQRKLHAPPTEYDIDVTLTKPYRPKLSVRRNSDSSEHIYTGQPKPAPMPAKTDEVVPEGVKRQLLQDLSKEVMARVSQRKNALVMGRETRGAIAAAEAKSRLMKKQQRDGGNKKHLQNGRASPRTCYSLEVSEDEKEKKHKDNDFVLVLAKDDTDAHKNDINSTMADWAQPKKALVSTDAVNPKPNATSETESGSTDESTRTVICIDNNNKDVVQKKVEYFEKVSEEQPYVPIIHRPAGSNEEEEASPDETSSARPKKLSSSQSHEDLKELFGERSGTKDLTEYVAPPKSSCYNGDCIDPVETVIKNGEVRKLADVFEHFQDFYSNRLALRPRRTRSNPEIHRRTKIVIPGQHAGDVDSLRRKYEYPWICGRGRSRFRRGGMVSPVYFRAQDRLMPHINIISKIASLYPRKTVFFSQIPQKSSEELARIFGCPIGEVEKLRQKFDSVNKNISLLGHMWTSSPNIHELRDIAPYLTASWTAHKYPRSEDNTRSVSSPDQALSSWDTSSVRKKSRPKSTSPTRSKVKLSPILKTRHSDHASSSQPAVFDSKMHHPVDRYQPPCPRYQPVRYKTWLPHTARPSVTFKGVVYLTKNNCTIGLV